MNFFAPLFASFAISLAVTLLVIKYAPKLGIMDDPTHRLHPARYHKKPTPRGGGIPIFFALLITTLIFLPLNQALAGILVGSLAILIIGVLDDRRDLSPSLRLVVNTFAAIVLIIAGVSITFFTNPFGGIIDLSNPKISLEIGGGTLVIPILSLIATIFWIVFITNIVSWSSGVDGQLAGFVPIAAVTIGALSLRFAQDITQWPVIILSMIIAGSYLGFLGFATYPQRIMPGYSGGALAGFLLGTLSILSGAKLATAIIVLGVPVMDAVFVIVRRIISGRSPLQPDAGHLHHRLLELGWGKPAIAVFYWLVAAVLGLLVLHLNSQAKFYTIVMVAALVGGMLVWLTFGKLLKRQG